MWVLETRQAFEAGAPGELLGRRVVSVRPGAHPHLWGAPSCMPPGPVGALWPPCGWDGPATSESCFCAAARAPVSLTLDPASYLSNSKRNSAAAEGKKITSAAELGGKRPSLASTGPSPAPCTPKPCTQPSLEPWMEPRLSQELGASLCSQRCVCVGGVPGGSGTPTLSEAAGWVGAPVVPLREGHLPPGHLGPDRDLSLSPCPDTAGGGSRGAVPSVFWNASLPFLSPETCGQRRHWLQATQGARAEPSETRRMQRVTFNPPQTLSSLSRVDVGRETSCVDVALRAPHAAQLSTAQSASSSFRCTVPVPGEGGPFNPMTLFAPILQRRRLSPGGCQVELVSWPPDPGPVACLTSL